MHLVIPFAAPLSESGRAALGALRLPALEALLARLEPAERDEGDEYQLSPPHERALARAWGWHGADGRLPFAAHAAEADGIELLDLAWGLMSPVHWQVGAEQLRMGDPDALGLDALESRAFFDAVRPLFESEGYACAWGAPTRWYVAHSSLADLPTASLDRVIGRNPDLWMPEPAAARPLKRLQSELQMLLYTHPLNEAREARGDEPLNTVWISGSGRRQPLREAEPVTVDARLRAPALREDWPAWTAAWRSLDDGPLREALDRLRGGAPLRLTLCGERHAQSFVAGPRGVLAALRARFATPRAAALLQDL
jgi:hypothetical protein